MLFGCCRRRRPSKLSKDGAILSANKSREKSKDRALDSVKEKSLIPAMEFKQSATQLSTRSTAAHDSVRPTLKFNPSASQISSRFTAADESVSNSTKSVDTSISSKRSSVSVKTSPMSQTPSQDVKNCLIEDEGSAKSPTHVHFQDVSDKPIRPTTSEFRSVEAKWMGDDPLKSRIDHNPRSKLDHDSKCAGQNSFGSSLSSITQPLSISVSPTPTNTPVVSSESSERTLTLNPSVIGFIHKLGDDESLKFFNTCDVKTAPEVSPMSSAIQLKGPGIAAQKANNVAQQKNKENPAEKAKTVIQSEQAEKAKTVLQSEQKSEYMPMKSLNRQQ
ncbi:hypothetical protein DdX_06628 [Ditylenchus destructor]|uniref:Uncharacterized protein n=1 Tax=Ditylenchus destructor TaxID=166010 RepID=A0AAD4NAS1_9BILA|nr:hypothetical protein DdX_06628 [Ditylenchus destructor]